MSKNEKITTHQKYPLSVKHGKPRLGKLKKGWQRVKIGDLVKEINRSVDMDDSKVYTLVKVKRSRGGVVKREDLQGKSISVKTQFYVREGDFLISKRQIVHGACGFVPKELDGAIVSNEYLILKCKNIIIPEFLNYLKDTIYFQQVCFHSSIGVHVEKMLFKVSQWYRWNIDIPDLEEQEKIASFLDTIALRITQLRRKHELLETYKKGVMQKIFSQQIRFKQDDGKPFPDWENKKLGELFDISAGGDIDSSKVQRQKDDIYQYPVYANAEKGKGLYGYSSEYKIEPGTITVAGRGVNIGIAHARNHRFYPIVRLLVLKPKFPLNTYFFESQINRIKIYTESTGVPQLTSPQISTYKVFCLSLKEQKKIANLLTSIDKKIEAVALQIEKLEEFKKGLLQKMFI